MHIKRAILKYGKENFSIEILEECPKELLNDREKYYIKLYNSYNSGYNSTLGGQNGVLITFKKIAKDKHNEIITIVDKQEYQKLMRFLNHNDPDAFITVYSVHDMRYKPKK